MAEDLLKALTSRGKQMRRRDLTKAEVEAVGEEVLKGRLRPDMDARASKRALRRAIDSAGASRSGQKSKG